MLLDSSLNALVSIYFQSIVFHTSGAKENFTISVKNKLNSPNIYFLRKFLPVKIVKRLYEQRKKGRRRERWNMRKVDRERQRDREGEGKRKRERVSE